MCKRSSLKKWKIVLILLSFYNSISCIEYTWKHSFHEIVTFIIREKNENETRSRQYKFAWNGAYIKYCKMVPIEYCKIVPKRRYSFPLL